MVSLDETTHFNCSYLGNPNLINSRVKYIEKINEDERTEQQFRPEGLKPGVKINKLVGPPAVEIIFRFIPTRGRNRSYDRAGLRPLLARQKSAANEKRMEPRRWKAKRTAIQNR